MRNMAKRLDRLEQESGTNQGRLIWVDSPADLERRRAELQPDDIVVHWQWSEDQKLACR